MALKRKTEIRPLKK